MGASSFSPSPITTTPAISTVSSIRRIASTAAWSASFFRPRPIQRADAIAAASVTRTSSNARLRSGIGPPEVVLEADDVVLAEVRTVLHLDELQVVGAGVLDAVRG